VTRYYNLRTELDDLRQSLIGAIESAQEEEESGNRWEQGHDAVALFSLSHAMMEEELQVLIKMNVFSEEYRESDAVEGWVSSNGFYQNMQFAHDVGLIDDGLKGRINDVRKTRNTLLHETDERLNIDHWDGRIDKINKAADTPYYLLGLIQQDTTGEE
jgi:hypothetical protein